jgi:hypothetical protein
MGVANILYHVNIGQIMPDLIAEIWNYSFFRPKAYGFVIYTAGQDVVGSFMKWNDAPIYTAPGIDPVPYAYAVMLNTDSYTIESFTPLESTDKTYTVSATAIGIGASVEIRVMVHYGDASNEYLFTFDCSALTDQGAYTKSNGDTGSAVPPFWNGFNQVMSNALKAVFVPNKEQIDQLLPTGVFASELNIFEDFNWGEKASGVYHMTVHFPKAHPNESQNWTITILTIDFDVLSSAAFITVIRTAIQAMIGLILVFILIMSFVG